MAVDIIFSLFVGCGSWGERLRQRVGSELRCSWNILLINYLIVKLSRWGEFQITRLIGVCLDPFHLAHFFATPGFSLGINYRFRADKSYNDLLRVGYGIGYGT